MINEFLSPPAHLLCIVIAVLGFVAETSSAMAQSTVFIDVNRFFGPRLIETVTDLLLFVFSAPDFGFFKRYWILLCLEDEELNRVN